MGEMGGGEGRTLTRLMLHSCAVQPSYLVIIHGRMAQHTKCLPLRGKGKRKKWKIKMGKYPNFGARFDCAPLRVYVGKGLGTVRTRSLRHRNPPPSEHTVLTPKPRVRGHP